jgi:kynurenine formamidase
VSHEPTARYIDLSHEIVDGMTTHPGIQPRRSRRSSRRDSAARYAPGTTFQIGRIEPGANTGTYIDTPARRFAGQATPATLALKGDRRPSASSSTAGAQTATTEPPDDRAIGPNALDRIEMADRVRHGIRTGWDRHVTGARRSTSSAIRSSPRPPRERIRGSGVVAVGIELLSVDSPRSEGQPAHTAIPRGRPTPPLVEHPSAGRAVLAGQQLVADPVDGPSAGPLIGPWPCASAPW